MQNRIVYEHKAFADVSPSEYWRLVIDGTQQTSLKEKGWWAYEKRERGSVKSLMRAYAFMLKTLGQPLTENLIQQFHRLVFEASSISERYVSSGGYSPRTGAINTRKSDVTEAGLKMLQQKEIEGRLKLYPKYEELDYGRRGPVKEGLYVIATVIDKPADLSKAINEILQKYEAERFAINSRDDSPDRQKALMENVIHCVQDLELLHPFGDGNCRVFCIIVLNKLLLENGFAPVILEDPNYFDGHTVAEMAHEIEKGMLRFKTISDIKPSTDEIIQLQVGKERKSDAAMIKPFLWAIASGLDGLAGKMLPVLKANINTQNKDTGRTPLMMAAAFGEKTLVSQMLEQGKADVNQTDCLGFTAAMWAAMMGYKDIAEMLLAAPNAKVESESKLAITTKDIFTLQQSEKSPFKLLPRLFNALPNIPYDARKLAFSEHDVSRVDENLVYLIDKILTATTLDKTDLASFLVLYSAMKQLKCSFPFKETLLAEIRDQILKFDLAKTPIKQMLRESDFDLVQSASFHDFPEAKQIDGYLKHAKAVCHYKGHRIYCATLSKMGEDLVKDKLFSDQIAAVDFVLSRDELIPLYLQDEPVLFCLFAGSLTDSQKLKLLEIISSEKNTFFNISAYDFQNLLERFPDVNVQHKMLDDLIKNQPDFIKEVPIILQSLSRLPCVDKDLIEQLEKIKADKSEQNLDIESKGKMAKR